jgi:hypothetical protein
MQRSVLKTAARVAAAALYAGLVARAEGAAVATMPASRPTSALGKLAAEMKPGTFALLNQDGDESGYSWSGFLVGGGPGSNSVGSIFAYAQKAAYDPIEDKVYFKGAPHFQGKSGYWATLAVYDVATNRWSATSPIPAPVGHAYDSNAINVAARELYASATLVPSALRRFDLKTKQWGQMAQPQSAGSPAGEPSCEYFPDRDELLMLQGQYLSAWTRSTDTWKRVARLDGLYFRSAVARYNPIHKAVLILGGADTANTAQPAKRSHAIYKYDAKGQITRLKDSPDSLCVYINQSLVVVDPVSGDGLFVAAVLGRDLNDYTGEVELWKHDLPTDAWTKLDAGIIPNTADWWTRKGSPFAVVVAPISKYGVVIFMSAAGKKSKVYLYKHAEPTATRPAAAKDAAQPRS